ncbi:MAG: hypothetical protein M3033_04580 [Acidobacteriota bacterium]|nr:hypothetical protein [Acidobacteriota bacterium]
MTNPLPKESARALLSEIIDYAGLFPPAQLSMTEAAKNYADYKKSEYNWMLGRFVVPVTRLEELADSTKRFFSPETEVWKITVLASEDVYGTVSEVEDFNSEYAPYAVCDALEVKANTGAQIEQIAESIPPELTTYFEIPASEELADMVATIAICRQRAKIRTGGIAQNAFPSAEQITRFMRTCLAANVAFKATAGLHHPLRCEKPLTYETNAETGTMHGFLNVFLAAALLLQGYKQSVITGLLEDEQAKNFAFNDNEVLWRNVPVASTAHLKHLRDKRFISFGSCSFEEPIADLREIGIL